MKNRTFIAISILIIGIVGVLTGPPLIEETITTIYGVINVRTVVNMEGVIFYIFSGIGLVLVALATRAGYKDDDTKFAKLMVRGGIFLVASGLLSLILSATETGVYLTALSGAAAIVTALSVNNSDIKIMLAIGISITLLATILLLPAINTITLTPDIFGGGAFSANQYTIFEMLFEIQELSALLILFAILSILGLVAMIITVIKYVKGDNQFFDNGLILGCSLAIASSFMFAIACNFDFDVITGAVYIVFFCGVGSLTTAILSIKGKI